MIVMKAISNYVLKFYMNKCGILSDLYEETHYMWHWLTGVGSFRRMVAELALYEINCSFSPGRGALAHNSHTA